MNYISYQEINAPTESTQSTTSKDNLQSTAYDHSLQPTVHSLHTQKTPQSPDSLRTAARLEQTVQKDHYAAIKAKVTTIHEPKSPQVSWCKSSIIINGKVHPLPTTEEYIYMNMLMFSKELELYLVAHSI